MKEIFKKCKLNGIFHKNAYFHLYNIFFLGIQFRFYVLISVVATCMLLVSGCVSNDSAKTQPSSTLHVPLARVERKFQRMQKAFGEDIVLWSDVDEKEKPVISRGLWYGALKTLENFPLDIADGAQGWIQTQWYTPPGQPDHRLQIKVLILPTKTICVEALQVTVLHQVLREKKWELLPVSESLQHHLKKEILLQARAYMYVLHQSPN